jgi:hypothetical protein
MKRCPDCSAKVRDEVMVCPECGGQWEEDGTFTGEQTTAVERPLLRDPLLGEMTASELRRGIRWGSFQGYLIATAGLPALCLLFMPAVVGCAGPAVFTE